MSHTTGEDSRSGQKSKRGMHALTRISAAPTKRWYTEQEKQLNDKNRIWVSRQEKRLLNIQALFISFLSRLIFQRLHLGEVIQTFGDSRLKE